MRLRDRRCGPFCKCADDQGNTVANQQALDQDARVVAPGEDRKAKRKGDGISFGQKSLGANWDVPVSWHSGEARRGHKRGTRRQYCR